MSCSFTCFFSPLNLGWFIVLSFYYFIYFILPLHENSCFKHLDTTPTCQALFSTFCCSIHVSIYRHHPQHLPRYLSIVSAPFSCISYVFHVLHFFIPFVSIASCCHVFLIGLWFFVLLVPYMSVFCPSLVKFFSFLCPLTSYQKGGDPNVIPQGE